MSGKEVVGTKNPKNSPLSVMYVEVNNHNFRNISCYSLSSGEALFDIAIIFASNINFNVNQRKAYLFHNENVTRVLSDVDTYIRPLQARGTKVLLSILGNHQGAGVCNFENVGDAHEFAVELKDAVDRYGLDGIDFDDEYADYGNNGTGQPNARSFIFLLRELRYLMPNKIISFYYYGPATSRLSYEGMVAGDFLDYSWNAIYGTYIPPNVPNLPRSRLGPAAVDVNSTGIANARSMATRTVQDGYGIYLYYALPNNDINQYLSGISEELYNGRGTLLTNGCLRQWPAKEGDSDKCCCSLPPCGQSQEKKD